jgi:ribosome-associated protein
MRPSAYRAQRDLVQAAQSEARIPSPRTRFPLPDSRDRLRRMTAEDGRELTGIVVDATHVIPRDEIDVRATRAGGPGGQHVNKTSSRIELRWSPTRSRALSPDERERVTARLSSRLDGDGVLRIVSSTTRSQLRNRVIAEERLAGLVRQALVVPKVRKATKPSRAARQARLDAKRQRGERKRERGSRNWD